MKNNKKGLIKSLVFVFALLAVALLVMPNVLKSLKFGLDLQGGFEVLYEVDSIDGSKLTPDMMTSTYKSLLKRIDILGVSEPVITIEGDNKIRVQLAGITNPDEARKILSSAATLTFRDTDDNLLMSSNVLTGGGAKVGQDSKGKPAVSLSVKDKDKFYKVTKRVSQMKDNKNVIVIWLDYEEGVNKYSDEQAKCGTDASRCLSAATVSQGFASDVIIQGNFTEDEVKSLVDLINSGSLPTKLTEISSKTVEASFGSDSLSKTFNACLIGFVIVVAVMIFLYHFAGFISSVGLLLYTLVTLGVFWLVGGVLTLPGIAAILLGIGMAVDSNVINFERIKDEMANGRSFTAAFKKGNEGSIITIFDANFTTFIVALILFLFGESTVKGFATMLMISVITTMVVIVFFTRFLLKLFVNTGFFDNKENFFIGRPNKEKKTFNFAKVSKKLAIVTLIFFIIGICSLFTNKLNLGVDFKGGTSINVKSEEKINIKTFEKELEKLGYKIDTDEVIDEKNVYVKVTDQLTQDEILSLQDKIEKDYKASSNIDVVSNQVKKELIKNAIISVLLSAIAIVIYISFRFKFNYGISAIAALVHDVFLIFAVFSLLKLEVQTIFIAALLSIIGYSINDTIVVFDRIRENKKDKKIKSKEDLEEIYNTSLNQMLKRSIITSLTTLVTVVSLIIFGSNEILNFNIALLIGLIAGTYSSVFIAGPLWVLLASKEIGKPKKKKWYEEDEPEEKKVKGINA